MLNMRELLGVASLLQAARLMQAYFAEQEEKTTLTPVSYTHLISILGMKKAPFERTVLLFWGNSATCGSRFGFCFS